MCTHNQCFEVFVKIQKKWWGGGGGGGQVGCEQKKNWGGGGRVWVVVTEK